jgi:hypothetical protein
MMLQLITLMVEKECGSLKCYDVRWRGLLETMEVTSAEWIIGDMVLRVGK